LKKECTWLAYYTKTVTTYIPDDMNIHAYKELRMLSEIWKAYKINELYSQSCISFYKAQTHRSVGFQAGILTWSTQM